MYIDKPSLTRTMTFFSFSGPVLVLLDTYEQHRLWHSDIAPPSPWKPASVPVASYVRAQQKRLNTCCLARFYRNGWVSLLSSLPLLPVVVPYLQSRNQQGKAIPRRLQRNEGEREDRRTKIGVLEEIREQGEL
eukprot:scpid27764/ scgid21177/ 